jgi:hypothetical protein
MGVCVSVGDSARESKIQFCYGGPHHELAIRTERLDSEPDIK